MLVRNLAKKIYKVVLEKNKLCNLYNTIKYNSKAYIYIS